MVFNSDRWPLKVVFNDDIKIYFIAIKPSCFTHLLAFLKCSRAFYFHFQWYIKSLSSKSTLSMHFLVNSESIWQLSIPRNRLDILHVGNAVGNTKTQYSFWEEIKSYIASIKECWNKWGKGNAEIFKTCFTILLTQIFICKWNK